MARIVGVHGVGKQRLGSNTLLKDWEPALTDELDRAAGGSKPAPDALAAFAGVTPAPRDSGKVGGNLHRPFSTVGASRCSAG
ncbi:hypothetical protein [Streptomyces sp. NPDC002845]